MPGKKKTPITENDAIQVILGLQQCSIEEWMEREGVPKDVITGIVDSNLSVLVERVALERADTMGAIFGALSTVFMYGWECGRELGRTKETTDG